MNLIHRAMTSIPSYVGVHPHPPLASEQGSGPFTELPTTKAEINIFILLFILTQDVIMRQRIDVQSIIDRGAEGGMDGEANLPRLTLMRQSQRYSFIPDQLPKTTHISGHAGIGSASTRSTSKLGCQIQSITVETRFTVKSHALESRRLCHQGALSNCPATGEEAIYVCFVSDTECQISLLRRLCCGTVRCDLECGSTHGKRSRGEKRATTAPNPKRGGAKCRHRLIRKACP